MLAHFKEFDEELMFELDLNDNTDDTVLMEPEMKIEGDMCCNLCIC